MALNHSSGLGNDPAQGWALSFEPGSRWQYSGQGYWLLQRAVERLTGQSLNRVVGDLVFRPLGMGSSSFVTEPRLQPRLVTGRRADGSAYGPQRLATAHAAYTLHTTAGDYGRFLAAVLRDDASLRMILQDPVPVDAALHLTWGQGWAVEHRLDDALIWQWGNTPGYKAFVLGWVGEGSGFVLLTNSDAGLGMARDMARHLVPGEARLFRWSQLR